MITLQKATGSVAAAIVLAATCALVPAATAHRSGSWQLPPGVATKLSARGIVGASCTGKGPYRHTSRSTPKQQTWLFKHFECFTFDGIGNPGVLYVCVHSLPGKRIQITKRMRNDEFRACRF